ncbi:MAG: mechanosensitive ion channel family protein [Elusimicrobiota bacterium]|jgi:small-conductance mechanosensitive channel|nr:mechanosensitive ion channel family protein [Elusimicrobiota bacterium]
MDILNNLSDISLQTVILENTVSQHITALAVFVISFIVLLLIRKFIYSSLKKYSKKAEKSFALHILESAKKIMPILFYLPFYITAQYIVLPRLLEKTVSVLAILISTYCIVRYLSNLIKFMSDKHFLDETSPALKNSVEFFANAIIWIMAILLVLNNLGFNINTLLAGVGIGGMAIALASQSLLSDLFNYLTILIDKPFTVGDDVLVNGHFGTVQKIGLKGTRIISFDGELIIASNTDMTKSVLKNYKVMEKRRKITIIGIRYDTPAAVIKEIPSLLQTIVKSVEGVEFARAHFSAFADSSLNFELVFYVLSKEYSIYMNKIQEINFKILDEFAIRKIEFAFPSSSVYLEKQ